MTYARRLLLPLLFALLLVGCSGDSESPEQRAQQLIDSAVEAGESRSTDGLLDLVHPNYVDKQGNNREQLGKLLRLYFLRHKSIHLFTRVDSIEILSPNEAVVVVHVAMAGTAMSDIDAISRLKASLYRFELQLYGEDSWQVRHASWSRASITDLE